MVCIYSMCRVENKLGQKEKERSGCQERGRVAFSIHPGPGELVHQSHHPLEVQNLPTKNRQKDI